MTDLDDALDKVEENEENKDVKEQTDNEKKEETETKEETKKIQTEEKKKTQLSQSLGLIKRKKNYLQNFSKKVEKVILINLNLRKMKKISQKNN